ncbi:hypothetical protein DPX16_22003 [Anabarilius grahami]|uniref:Uncharacterized protein n=1 Tax=Anabarilius grahami TaxID=495550 RepID=A0A3N0XMK8_ANAGA|nr:hypothetical protein DPX16_22003 [Anabarilius grahami]
MPRKSTGERSQSYRDRLKEDPVKYEERLKRDRERYLKKKERGVVKPIADLSKREQRKRRRQWRTNTRNYREKMNKGLKDVKCPHTGVNTEGGETQQILEMVDMDETLYHSTCPYCLIWTDVDVISSSLVSPEPARASRKRPKDIEM